MGHMSNRDHLLVHLLAHPGTSGNLRLRSWKKNRKLAARWFAESSTSLTGSLSQLPGTIVQPLSTNDQARYEMIEKNLRCGKLQHLSPYPKFLLCRKMLCFQKPGTWFVFFLVGKGSSSSGGVVGGRHLAILTVLICDDMGWYGYIWVTMVGRLVFVLCSFFFVWRFSVLASRKMHGWDFRTSPSMAWPIVTALGLPSAAISRVGHHVFASAWGGKSTLLLVLHLWDGWTVRHEED